MSYILDALKKSQQERELGDIPTLKTGVILSPEQPATSSLSRSLLIVSVLLLAATLLLASYLLVNRDDSDPKPAGGAGNATPPAAGEMTPASPSPAVTLSAPARANIDTTRVAAAPLDGQTGQDEDPATMIPSSPLHQSEKPAPAAEPRVTAAQTPVPGEKQQTARTPRHTVPPVSAAQADPKEQMRREFMAIKQQLDRERKTAAAARRSTQAPTPRGNTVAASTPDDWPESTADPSISVPALPGSARELPLSVQNRLPQRKVSVLAYSEEPERRFIILNSRKMRQGEGTNEGLTVETILKDGVIYRFDEHLFFDSMY